MRCAGTAATALAVSWAAGAMTRRSTGRPVCSASLDRSVPIVVPGGEIGPRILAGMPSSASMSRAQSPRVAIDHLARRRDRGFDRPDSPLNQK